MAVKVNIQKCNGCGKCIDICPMNAITLLNAKAEILEPKCRVCCACVMTCPLKAIA